MPVCQDIAFLARRYSAQITLSELWEVRQSNMQLATEVRVYQKKTNGFIFLFRSLLHPPLQEKEKKYKNPPKRDLHMGMLIFWFVPNRA